MLKINHEPIGGNFITALVIVSWQTIYGHQHGKQKLRENFMVLASQLMEVKLGVQLFKDERPHNFGFKLGQVMVATDNGVFRSSDIGKTWILPGSIYDPVSNTSITTSEFFSAASQGQDVWIGSG